jgi:hypothetical protein
VSEEQERIVILNLGVIARRHLFQVARTLLDTEEGYGSALSVVVAQTVVELAFETAIDFSLQLQEVPEPLQEWIAHRGTIGTWSPTNPRVQRLWTGVTGDTITAAPAWEPYKARADLRHGVVHWARPVARNDAEAFISASEGIVSHVLAVMTRMADELEGDGPAS